MKLRQIEVFRAVMLAGSVTGAAKLPHVSQPGISRMLGHIELQLGVALFERGRGKLEPTPEARALYAEVEQVYRGVQRIGERARSLKEGGGLVLRVLASPSLALEVVPLAVARLAERYPAARLYLETQLVREMRAQLLAGDAELAFATLPIEHALLASRAIGTWSLACVFPAGHAFERRRSVGVRDFAGERLIAFSADTPQGRLIAEAWQGSGAEAAGTAATGGANEGGHSGDKDQAARASAAARAPREPAARIEVRSGQVACALAACGAGVAVVDELTARAWPGERLRFRPLARAAAHEVSVVQHAQRPLSKLAAELVTLTAAALREVRRRRAD